MRLLGRFSGYDPDAVNTVEAAGRIRCPVLLVHGQADTLVELDQAREILARLSVPESLWVAPEAGHSQAWDKAGAALVARLDEFYNRYL